MEQLMQRNTLYHSHRDQYLFHIIKKHSDSRWWHQIGRGWKNSYIENEQSINFLKGL